MILDQLDRRVLVNEEIMEILDRLVPLVPLAQLEKVVEDLLARLEMDYLGSTVFGMVQVCNYHFQPVVMFGMIYLIIN